MMQEEARELQVGTLLHSKVPSSTRCLHWKVVDRYRQINPVSFYVQLHHGIWDRAVLNQANAQFYHLASACHHGATKEASHA